MLKDYFRLAIQSILDRKLRSVLTVLGIIIGVAAIISLISVGEGMRDSISSEFEKIGSNIIYVMPKGSILDYSNQGLTQDDADLLDTFPEFKWVNAYFVQDGLVEYRNDKVQTNIFGVYTDSFEERWEQYDIHVEKGRPFREGEKFSVILGYLAAEDMFDDEIRVNNNLEIEGHKFKVIGIYEEIGNPEDDNTVNIPLDAARQIFDEPKGLNFIEMILKPGVDVDQTVRKVQRKLEKKHDAEDFEVITPEQLLGQFNSVLGIVQAVVVGVAMISLVVGAIGIMNSMYTSVLERTKEIGIMKAIGARRSDIVWIFLIESSILGLIGGLIGTGIGFAFGELVEAGAASVGFTILKVSVTPELLIGGLLFAVVVGALSGALPARAAAKMQPVEALRK